MVGFTLRLPCPYIRWIAGSVCPRACFDVVTKKKFLPLSESESRLSGIVDCRMVVMG
jgi:hypothetical protein